MAHISGEYTLSTGRVAASIFIANLALYVTCTGERNQFKPTVESISGQTDAIPSGSSWRYLMSNSESWWRKSYPDYQEDYFISSYKRNNQDKLSKLLLGRGYFRALMYPQTLIGALDTPDRRRSMCSNYKRQSASRKTSLDSALHRDSTMSWDPRSSFEVEWGGTWVYTPWSSSWFRISRPHPPSSKISATRFNVLPTLCNTLVVYVESSRKLWVFNGENETWHLQELSSDPPKDISVSKGVIALDSSVCTDTSCLCKGSIVFYSDPDPMKFTTLECNSQSQQSISCQWKFPADVLAFPKEFAMQRVLSSRISAVSDKKRGSVYFSSLFRKENDGMTILCIIEVQYKPWRYDSHRCYSEEKIDELSSIKMVLWENFIIISSPKLSRVVAVSTENGSWHKPMFFDPYNNLEAVSEILLTTPSSDLVRFSWLSQQTRYDEKLNILLYRCQENCSLNSSAQTVLSFTQKKTIEYSESPGYLCYHTSVYDAHSNSFFIYGGLGLDANGDLTLPLPGVVWIVSITKNKRWIVKPEKTPRSYISACGTSTRSHVVLFGGGYETGAVTNELWLFDTQIRLWKQIITEKNPWPDGRIGCSLNALSETKLLLYGGYSGATQVKQDMWSVDIDTNSDRAIWHRITLPAASHNKAPSSRFGHSSLIVHDQLIIYGGKSSLRNVSVCLYDMWVFNIARRKWKQILSSSTVSSWKTYNTAVDCHYCDSFILPYDERKVVVLETRYQAEESTVINNSVRLVDTFLATERYLTTINTSFTVLAAGKWEGNFVYYAINKHLGKYGNEDRLIAFGRSCSPGTAQYNGPNNAQCTPCPYGWYSKQYFGTSECIECPSGTMTTRPGMDSIEGCICKPGSVRRNKTGIGQCDECLTGYYTKQIFDITECSQCPKGLTTVRTGMLNISSCVCDPTYCKHGECKRTGTGNGEIGAVCTCSFGIAGDRCHEMSHQLYILLFGVSIILTFITTALVYCGVRAVRQRRAKQRTELELEETRKAFTIQAKEIRLLNRLDEDCPGGYGRVDKATYRDWTVAVKQVQLAMTEWADVRREFLREIQFMRRIRHPKIVMFIGAGQYNENCPFLVLEFMEGGALQSLLKNLQEELTMMERLHFALDTAEGMEYLHTLQPPRIHRDLKSANLLLSRQRQVRIADFGSARLIPKPDGKLYRRTRKRHTGSAFATSENKQEGLSQYLLSETEQLSSTFIGTARWRSPELWRKESYGRATDVYSFGIVLWEVITRQTPFSGPDYRFDAQVENAVLSGVRPIIPSDTPAELSSLIEECWQQVAKYRPQFKEIVAHLQCLFQEVSNNAGSFSEH